MTHTCMCGAVCLRCLLCLNVPAVYSQCQALMCGAPGTANVFQCVQVCAVVTLGSDRLKLSVENSRLQRAFSAYPSHRTHKRTHAVVFSGCRCGLQPIITPWRSSQANQTGLALPRTESAACGFT